MTDGGPAESVEDQAAGQEAAVEPLLELIAELDADARLQALTHSSWTERRIANLTASSPFLPSHSPRLNVFHAAMNSGSLPGQSGVRFVSE